MDNNTDPEDTLVAVIERRLKGLSEASREQVETLLWQIHADFEFELVRHQYGLD